MASGFFAQASIVAANFPTFNKEFQSLTKLALDEDKGNYEFREIYNPYTGKPDGGYQGSGAAKPNHHWASCRLQSWSATAYINMIHYGIAGIRMDENRMTFSPYLPEDVHYLKITGLVYRQSRLNVVIKGSGKKIKAFLLNGVQQIEFIISSGIKGENEIEIVME